MKFLIISERGDFSGAALRLVKEGNQVKIWLKEPRARKTMVGLLEQVKTVQEGTQFAPDVIVFDMVGMGAVAEKLQQNGWKVVGGGKLHDDLELDRSFGFRVMESFGIKTPATYAFPNFSDATKFLLSHRRRLVFKPSQNLQTNYTFVGQTNDEVLNFISQLLKVRKINGSCILQDFVPGTEVSTEVWYSHGKPVAYPNGTIELKKFMSNGLGVTTGSMASVVWPYPTREPRLIQKSLKKMSILLEKKKYTGALDINGIVKEGKFYGLEFSARFGYNALYALLPILGEDFGSILYRLATGDTEPLRFAEAFGCALRVSIPPYPAEADDEKTQDALYQATRGYYVEGVKKDAWGQTVFPLDIYATEAGLITAGFDGIIAEVAGAGESVDAAYAQAENEFYGIQLPNKQARLRDIIYTTERSLNDLAAMNYDVPGAYPEIKQPEVAVQPTPQIKKEVKHGIAKKTVSVPAHMARTTLSMPRKYS